MSIIAEIQKKIFLTTKRKTINALEGAYKATMHSRSLDFDDLKEYTPGDNAKDISWKATAKSPKLLVKRFVADKQFPVTFIVDTGKNMKALSSAYNPKPELLEAVLAVLGKVVINHNDSLGCIIGDNTQSKRFPFKNSLTHLENILNEIRIQLKSSEVNKSDPIKQLELLMKLKTGRSIVIVVSENPEPSTELSSMLTKVKSRHDMLWVSIGDANPFETPISSKVLDIETDIELPPYLRSKTNLSNLYSEKETLFKANVNEFFKQNRISYIEITSMETVVPALTELLIRRKNDR